MKSGFILCLAGLMLATISLHAQNFDKKEIISDLEFLCQSLEEAHYNLYAYTDKKEFTNNYLKIKRSITQDSLSLLQATSLFQQVISKANTGHAEIDFPVSTYRNYAMNGGTVFPLELAIEDGKAYIRKNFSNSNEVKTGLEVVAIDDVEIQKVIDKIHPQLSAETPYFKNAKLEFWSFPRLYWQLFGQRDSFKIAILKEEKIIDAEVAAVDLISDFEMKRTEIVSSDRLFKLYKNAAYVKPGNFSGDVKEYKAFIDSVFTELNNIKRNNLIVDLRNNAGGHNEFSDYLVSYFADKPFKWHSKFTLKSSSILKAQTRLNNDTTDLYFKKILEQENGATYEYLFENYKPQNESARFKGNVYVLINRHSYSMAAVTAAMIQDYKFATIVGEQTGDFPTLYASQFQYTLPNTGIVVKVPKGYMIRPNGTEYKGGVIPDVFIKDHLIDDNDEILEGLLKQLKEQ